MANFSNYFENLLANFVRGVNMPTAPSDVYVGLHNGNPTDTGTGGTNVTTTIRPAGRPTATFGSITGTTTRTIASNSVVNFGTADGGATVTHQSIWTGSTTGDMIIYGSLPSTATVEAGDSVTVPETELQIEISGDSATYLKDIALNWMKGTAAPTAPAGVFMALFNGNPTSGGSEVTATIRAAGRVAVAFGAASDGVITSTADVDFGVAVGAATVDFVAIYDAASAGNMLAFKAISSRAIQIGDGVRFNTGAVTFTVA